MNNLVRAYMNNVEEHTKQELILFIKWKCKQTNDLEWFKGVEQSLKDMDLLNLTRWAIRYDFIDA